MRRLDDETATDRGENPGGRGELRRLLYPFHKTWPRKAWSKLRWRLNGSLAQRLPRLNACGAVIITVIDRLGAPGDALLTAIVIHNLKRSFPRSAGELHHATSGAIAQVGSFDRFPQRTRNIFIPSTPVTGTWSSHKDASTNVVAHSLAKVGIDSCEYKARFYLSEEESTWGKQSNGWAEETFVFSERREQGTSEDLAERQLAGSAAAPAEIGGRRSVGR